MKTKNNLSKLLLSFVLVAVCIVLMIVSRKILNKFNLGVSEIKTNFIHEAFAAVYAIVAMVIAKRSNIIKPTVAGFGEGISTGAVILVLAALSFLSFFFNHGPITASTSDIPFYIMHMILIGVTEEVLFRGILQNACHDFFGEDTRKKVMLGIIVASAMFGMTHFINLLSGGSFVSVAVQAVSSIAAGVIFGICYYRSGKNLWVCIILHALLDGAGFLDNFTGSTDVEVLNEISLKNLAVKLVLIVVIIYVSRNIKPVAETVA